MIARRPGINLGVALSFAAAGMLAAPAPAAPAPDAPQRRKSKRTVARIIMDGAVGDVTHVFSDEPLSKRRKRRLRARNLAARQTTDREDGK